MRPGSYVSCMQCRADLTKKGVKRKRCAGCHSVFYDAVTCQEKDWAIHKTECKELQRRFIAAVRFDYPEVDTMAKLLARPDACGAIAHRYSGGEGRFEQNDGLALFWAMQWVKGGDAKALMMLGTIFLSGLGVPEDYSKSLKFMRRAADLGEAASQCQIGMCYHFGKGVQVNKKEAAKWYRLGAEGGDEYAQSTLGMMLAYGPDLEVDLEEALTWLRKAADQGDAVGQFHAGVLLFKKHEENTGADTADAEEAVKWFRRAAEQGHVMAQSTLGQCLADGDGVAKDPIEAAVWYRKSADQGDASAQFHLGVCYINGIGVDIDRDETLRLFRLSAAQGYDKATTTLRFMAENTDLLE